MKQVSSESMGTRPLLPLIITLSSPIMLSLLVQSLYNIIDSVYISRYNSNGLTALSLAFPVQTLITAAASGTGAGTNIIIAKALGANDKNNASSTAFNGFVLSLINWSFFVIIGILILKPYFSIFTANTEVASLGLKYLSIILLFSIAPFTENVAVRILQATGNTVLPMIFQSTAALLNLILDPIFIWGFGFIPAMGISGAAIATVLSQFLSATLAVITVFFKQTVLTVSFRIPSFNLIKEIFITGLPSVLGMALVSAYISGLNAVLTRFSEDAVSSLGIYYKLQTFLLIPTYGLNQGVTPIMGFNYGAKKYRRMWNTLWYSLIISTATLIAGTLCFCLFTREILLFFHASDSLLHTGIPALRIISTSFPFFGLTILMPTLFQSTGYIRQNIIITLPREVVLLVPIAWAFSHLGLTYTWLTFPISESIAAFISCYYTYILFRGPLTYRGLSPE